MRLALEERETIITYNELEKTASVYTHNRRLRHKLDTLTESHPDDCQLIREDHEGQAKEYQVPRKWIKVSPPRKARELTEDQRKINAERLAKAREARRA